MVKKIIWAVVEWATIAGGAEILIRNIKMSTHSEQEGAGIGAFIIVTGILLRSWRKENYFKIPKQTKEDSSIKN